MKTAILAGLCIALVCFDLGVTISRTLQFGPEVELNPVVRFLARRLGAISGSILGLVPMNFAVIAMLVVFHFDSALSFILGLRTMLTLKQLASFQD
jgi:hypothetical protein